MLINEGVLRRRLILRLLQDECKTLMELIDHLESSISKNVVIESVV